MLLYQTNCEDSSPLLKTEGGNIYSKCFHGAAGCEFAEFMKLNALLFSFEDKNLPLKQIIFQNLNIHKVQLIENPILHILSALHISIGSDFKLISNDFIRNWEGKKFGAIRDVADIAL